MDEFSARAKLAKQVELNTDYIGALHGFLEKRAVELETEGVELRRMQKQIAINESEIEVLWRCLHRVMKETGQFPELEAVDEEELA